MRASPPKWSWQVVEFKVNVPYPGSLTSSTHGYQGFPRYHYVALEVPSITELPYGSPYTSGLTASLDPCVETMARLI